MVQQQQNQFEQRVENLGSAERIIQSLTTHLDHLFHGRPGMVVMDGRSKIGVRWDPVTWRKEGSQKVVYRLQKDGKKTRKMRVGVLQDDDSIVENRRIIGEYRKPGLFPESATYLYRQVADVWKMDNEFAAHWASWAFAGDHRDLKVILAAFMLVQDRFGEPVVENGEILFYDDDFRAVGEAMCLLKAKNDINPKLLLRIGDILVIPGVVEINRELGFGRSARNPAMGRYRKVVEKWLRYREENPNVLNGLVKAGFRTTVMALARKIGYKPSSSKFFETLRWKQVQAKDGRRELAIGIDVKKAESWDDLTEKEICERITKEKPGYKRIVGLLPKEVGLTRAIMAATIEAGSVSNQDLIILTPTLEELGLLNVKDIKVRWEDATKKAENQRAENIAKRVKSKEIRDGLEEAVDNAAKRAMEKVTKDLRIYVVVDRSGSMQGAIERAKKYLTKLLVGFPLDRLHVSVFNTIGVEIRIRESSAKAVEHAFRGHYAGGGTIYAEGIKALSQYKPKESEDSLIIFVGDQGERPGLLLASTIRESGLNPVAFGMLNISGNWGLGEVVYDAARRLNIPCFDIEEEIFSDPYSVTRNLRNLIASTPVQVAPRIAKRKTLVEEILKTPLLRLPLWCVRR